ITASENLSIAILEWNGVNETMHGNGNNWYLNKTGLSSGTYAYKVYGNDTVDNWNSSEKREIIVDTTTPSITLYSPQNNTVITNAAPTFNFTTTDNIDTNLTCELFINNSGYGIVSAPNGTPTTITANNSLADGTYHWYINCTDDAQNTGKSAVWMFKIEAEPPSIGFVQPTTDAGNYSQDWIAANVTASDEDLETITIYLYNTSGLVNSTTRNASPLFINWTNLSDGLYYLNATANDTYGNTNSTETRKILLDTTPPIITATHLEPYDPAINKNVSLDLNASDNIQFEKHANITYPNGTKLTLNLPAEFTPPIQGKYNVTFFVNDAANNIATSEDYFIAGAKQVYATFNAIDHTLADLDVNLTIYFTGTDKIVESESFTGTFSRNATTTMYDLLFTAFNNTIKSRLNEINLSSNGNNTIGLDRYPSIPGFIIAYSISTDYTFKNTSITISYSNMSFKNEDHLAVYYCSDWNFTSRTCSSSWTKIASTQNKTSDTFTIERTTLSAFAIKQESYCGDGVCNPDEDCESCPDDCGVCKEEVKRRRRSCISEWNCTDWSPCTPEGLQYRTCIDMRNCRIPFKKPPETRECTYIPSCNNSIKDVNETDVDCGGICPPCPDGKKCITDDDCIGKCDPIKKICYTQKIKPEIPMPRTIRSIQAFVGFVNNIFKISKDIFIKAPINLIKGLSTIIIKNKFLAAYTIIITTILIIVLQIGKIKQRRLQKKIERYLKKLREEGKL
ncbi:hypothetical protein KY307_01860, partial [Candidatus Woesearchaeota archaeon]|nr:hypothetical protein [Candidatus Woesearchaeota archaeon]